MQPTQMIHFPPSITDRRIRFALVGCGRIAANHFVALERHLERAEVVAVCNVDSSALNAAVASTGGKGYESITAMLSECNADIVVLATPSGLHSAAVCVVTALGRSVLAN
jgi:UDP-N-acetyl-2-amino-2-deoxyglucuronate dehydrogenase